MGLPVILLDRHVAAIHRSNGSDAQTDTTPFSAIVPWAMAQEVASRLLGTAATLCVNSIFIRLVFIALLVCMRSYAQPAVDHHQHLLRSAVTSPKGFALSADELIAQMDEAGIRRAVILSIAYQFGNPSRPPIDNEHARVKEENDWTREQAALYHLQHLRSEPAEGICVDRDRALRERPRASAGP